MTNNKPMYDITYLCDNNLHEFIGGTEQSVKIILNSLSGTYRLSVIQPGQGKESKYHQYDEFNNSSFTFAKALFKHPLAFIKYIDFCRRTLSACKTKVVHVQAHVSFFIVGFLIELHLIDNDFVLIYTDRGLYTKYNNFFKKLFLHYMKYLDILVTTTEFNRQYWNDAIKNKYPRKDLKYEIIPNTAGREYEIEIEDTILNSKGSDDPFIVGFAGRYCDWKNWPLAEEICTEINKRDNSIHFWMVIACNSERDNKETELMFQRLKDLCGHRFIGKINIKPENMKEFYKVIDLFILTSNKNSESFGRTLIEAMSLNTAVLLTDAGGATEVVGDRKYICNNAKEFADKAIAYKNNKEELISVKKRNYERTREAFSLSRNIEKHFLMYSEILSSHL